MKPIVQSLPATVDVTVDAGDKDLTFTVAGNRPKSKLWVKAIPSTFDNFAAFFFHVASRDGSAVGALDEDVAAGGASDGEEAADVAVGGADAAAAGA